MSEALGASNEEIVGEIERMREDIAAEGLDPNEYARPVISTEKFVLPCDFLK